MGRVSPNVYKILAQEADEFSRTKKQIGQISSNGWTVVDNSYDHDRKRPFRSSNFKGVLYEKDGQYALAFPGTDGFNLKDWGTNLKMGLTGHSKQSDLAKEFAENMMDKYNLNADNTVSLGASEGGHEATQVGIKNGLPTFTYNAWGVRKNDYPGNYDDLVTNYRDPHDPVSKVKQNVGKTYVVPNNQGWFKSKTPFGSIDAHRIQNMGDLDQAIPVEEYKKQHPLFFDHISDAEITREDIAMMEPEIFSIYENEIDERMKNNQIRSNSDLEELMRRMGVLSQRPVNGFYRRVTYV